MAREVCFTTRNYESLTKGAIYFLFIALTAALAEKMKTKACLWENALQGNVWPYMAESSQLLAINIVTLQVDWVMTEQSSEVLAELLNTLWYEIIPPVAYLLSLVYHNEKER